MPTKDLDVLIDALSCLEKIYRDLEAASHNLVESILADDKSWAVDAFSEKLIPNRGCLEYLARSLSQYRYEQDQDSHQTIKFPGVIGVSDTCYNAANAINDLKLRFAEKYLEIQALNKKKARTSTWAHGQLERSQHTEARRLLNSFGGDLKHLSIKQVNRSIPIAPGDTQLISWHWKKQHRSMKKLSANELMKSIDKMIADGGISESYGEASKRKLAQAGQDLRQIQTAKRPILLVCHTNDRTSGKTRRKEYASLPLIVPRETQASFRFYKNDPEAKKIVRPSRPRTPVIENKRIYAEN